MVAGTVLTDLDLEQLRRVLEKNGVDAEINDDELKIRDEATVYFRTGFEHEYILVGDAREREPLLRQVQRISEVLKRNDISHAFEIYDTDNDQVHDYEFTLPEHG